MIPKSFISAAALSLVFGATLAGSAIGGVGGRGEQATVATDTAYARCVYLCQKKDCYGTWRTQYTCYDRRTAMAWYDNQASNARVVAVEK